MTSEMSPTRLTTATFDVYEGLVSKYVQTNLPLAAGVLLPAIPDEFVAALESIDPHDPDAFQQLLSDYNIDDAAALTAILRVVRFYGGTAALSWLGTEIGRTDLEAQN